MPWYQVISTLAPDGSVLLTEDQIKGLLTDVETYALSLEPDADEAIREWIRLISYNLIFQNIIDIISN